MSLLVSSHPRSLYHHCWAGRKSLKTCRSRSSTTLSIHAQIGTSARPLFDLISDIEVVPANVASLYKRILSRRSRKTPSHELQKDSFGASKALAIWVCDSLEKTLLWVFADHSTVDDDAHDHPSDDNNKPNPHFYLDGYYAPVDQETNPTSDLPVSGSIPECLNGEIVRIVPNPRFNPIANYQWFDGDGFLHGLKIKDGKASYVARFVQTSRLQQEEVYGAAKFFKIGDMHGMKGICFGLVFLLRIMLGVLDISNGFGTANTGLVYHNNKLLALYEADKPYAIKVLEDGDFKTMGRVNYGSPTDYLTAHPKIDPVTGEMFGFYYQIVSPYLTYQVFSKEGVLMESVPITVRDSVVMHDFAITENYAIVMDLSLVIKFKNLIHGEHLIKFDPNKESRLGLLPRYAKDDSQIRWFTIPTCMIFHNANAWEEGDEVVLVSCRMQRRNFTMWKEYFPPTNDMDLESPQLYEFRLKLDTGQVTQKHLSTLAIEVPRINEYYIGRKQQYTYACLYDDMIDKFIGVVKYDLSLEPHLHTRDLRVGGNIKGVFLHGKGRWGSEAIFVPRIASKEILEDDGYLICFVHDERIGNSEVVIIDAKTMASKPVAVISLPSKVPSGFHSTFLSQVRN
ncbi:unnamed protein product [Sphagnum jensenii]